MQVPTSLSTPTEETRQEQAPELLITSANQVEAWMSTCPHAGTLTGYSLSLQSYVIIAQTCKTWSCPVCGRRRISRLAHRVRHAAPNRLCTLTVDPARHETPKAAFHATSKSLSVLVRDLRRDFGSWEHLRVLEVTKKGWPHFHLMVRSPFVPVEWVKRHWQKLTGAFIVDLRQIKATDKVYWYVVKYLAKQTKITFTNRRVSHTRGFFQDPPYEPRPGLDLAAVEKSHQHPAAWLQQDHRGGWITRVSADCWIIGREGGASASVAPPS